MQTNRKPQDLKPLIEEQLQELLDWAESTDNWELVELSTLALQENELAQNICAVFVQTLRERLEKENIDGED
jgi:hypothetical protein